MSKPCAILAILPLLAVVTSAIVYAEDEKKIEFEGFSRSGEAAVEKLLKAIEKVETYSDEAVAEFKSSAGFGGNEQGVPFVYKKPDKFRLQNMMYDISADGKELTVYMKNNRRYLTEPLRADAVPQLKKYGMGMWVNFGIAELFLSKDHKAYLAERFKNFNATGDETVDGDKCVLLEGLMKNSGAMGGDGEVPIKVFLREKDWMIRRVEIDMTRSNQDSEEEEDNSFARAARDFKIVYDVKQLQVNHEVDSAKLAFKAPSGAKKVDQFYSSWMHMGDSAQQFELSGKSAPDFDLETTDGGRASIASLKGKVAVLDFLMPEMGFRRRGRGGGSPPLGKLDEIRREFADKGVIFLCIQPQASADDLVEEMRENDYGFTVALDPDRTATTQYFEERWSAGVVLVGKDGVVQGKYPGYMTDDHFKSLRGDLDKLLKGETLPGGKPMSEEQLHESEDQRTSYFGGDTPDPINEDYLTETWDVRAAGERSFGFGAGQPSRSGLWIRSKDSMQEIDASGHVVAEIPLPNPNRDEFSQDQIVVGQFGGRRGVVYMTSTPSEEANQWGWKPPKGVTITAGDESGKELWKIEMEVKNQQIPQQLTLADLDGRAGDELIFAHQGSIWIVNDRGETIVRKPINGWASWLRADDLDRDKRAELYVRTQNKLHRFDYKGKR